MRHIKRAVCIAFLVAMTLSLSGCLRDDRAEIIALYYENEAFFAEIAASGNFADAESINGVSVHEVSWSHTVEFICRAHGFYPGNGRYYGISYVPTGNWQDVSHCGPKFRQGVVVNDDETIYEYKEKEGDDYWYAMKLSGDYWYYEVQY